MSIAKIISLFGGTVYLFVFLGDLLFPKSFGVIFTQSSQINLKTAFAILLAGTFLTSIINFSYFYYLYNSQRNGEEINSSVFYSLQLLILPLIVVGGLLTFFVFGSV